LVDGREPFWQGWTVPLFPVADRPSQAASLRGALTFPIWPYLFDLLAGQTAKFNPSLFSASAAKELTGGEQRLVWAFLAWHYPAAPKDLLQVLREWSASDPAPVSPEL